MPRPGLVEAEVARLRIVHQHAVARGGEQPGHGVIGRVGTRVEAPGGHEDRDDRLLVLLVGPLGHVVLDLPAALVHAVGALAEAEVALAGACHEGDPGGLCERSARAGDLHVERHHAVRVGAEPDGEPAPVGVGGGEGALPDAVTPARVEHAGGPEPARGGAEAERAGRLAEDRPAAAVQEPKRPGVAPCVGAQRAPRPRSSRRPARPSRGPREHAITPVRSSTARLYGGPRGRRAGRRGHSSFSSSSSSRSGIPWSPAAGSSGLRRSRAASTAPGRRVASRKPRRW